MLEGKNAVIYGAGGAIGGAIARTFAARGAHVFLVGRSAAALEAVAEEVAEAGGLVESAQVDALDENAVGAHVDAVVAAAGRIDITVNAVGIDHIQGVPLAELSTKDYLAPITAYTLTHFLTATAAARHMVRQRSGVILTLSTPGALMADGVASGFGVACAAIEGLTRQLAGELGAYGIRAVCLRPDGIPEAIRAGSHSGRVFARRAEILGISLDRFVEGFADGTLLKRAATLEDVANVAAFMASDQAQAITATTANISAGSVVG
jgi:NAD(P)-dependent dehydrogenase (short-subunit alcohol dehydrogenase family)